MTKHKLFTLFVMGAALVLTAVLPALARDREDRGTQKEPRGISTPSATQGIPAGFRTSKNSTFTIHRMSTPRTSDRPSFMQKAYCYGECGDGRWFECWGESASCADGDGCSSAGGGLTFELYCY